MITGHDASGRSTVLFDDAPSNVRVSTAGSTSWQIWSTSETPADLSDTTNAEDMGRRILGTPPSEGGTRMSVNEFPPGITPLMHRTDTIDYVIVISGGVEMQLDDRTIALEAGDVLVQRGTVHAWINRGTETARVAFVLVDAKPLGFGNPIPRGKNADTK